MPQVSSAILPQGVLAKECNFTFTVKFEVITYHLQIRYCIFIIPTTIIEHNYIKSDPFDKMSEQEISREDLDLIDRIFDIIDINADGTVDIKHLKQNLPSCCEGARLKDVQAILDEMAANIDWTDFIDALKLGLIHQKEEGSSSVLNEEEEEEDIRQWTRRREQTRHAKVHRLDTQKDPLTKEMRKGLLKMFNRMDPDGDGYVTLQEFQGFMMEHRSAVGSKKIGLSNQSASIL